MYKNKEKLITNPNGLKIHIDIGNKRDFFGDFEYTHYRSSTLNYRLEDYILRNVMRYPPHCSTSLTIYVSEGNNEFDSDIYKETIHQHFKKKVIEGEVFFKEQLKQWRINMVIGILFLMFCIICVEILDAFTYIKIIKVAKESLLIVGWVALWEPITFILFGRRTISRNLLYYKKLSKAYIEVVILPEKVHNHNNQSLRNK